jgi:hypothetical protein
LFFIYDESKPGIFDFKVKWEMDSLEYINTIREFPGESLSKKLEKILKKLHLPAGNYLD